MTRRAGQPGTNGNGHVSAFQVQSGVPIPLKRIPRAAYPFAQLAVGDSFFVPGGSPQSLTYARSAAEVEFSASYATRKVTESGTSGVRVWRTR